MVNMNDAMRALLCCAEEKDFQLGDIVDEIVNSTKMIKECIIYDKCATLNEEQIDFARIISFFGDLTGYEVGCNEIRYSSNVIVPNQIMSFAKDLCYKIAQRYNGIRLVVYINI